VGGAIIEWERGQTMLQRMPGGARGARGRISAAALVAVATIALGATPALASSLKEEFAPFDHCPIASAGVCVVANTTGGEFVIGHKTVPIDKTVTLQGGLASESFSTQPLIAPVGAEALSKTPLTVPGGLVGIAELGGEVTATAELAAPASSVTISKNDFLFDTGTAVTLPLKVKLENPVLGSECYVGSDEEPIVLHLTTGKTSPPAPAESIHGGHSVPVAIAKRKITFAEKVTLVDNDFAVPGAQGCGGSLSPIVDEIVDTDVGIPSKAGENTAIMTGSLEESAERFVAKYIPKEKKAKK
jgi:hypothetical protein